MKTFKYIFLVTFLGLFGACEDLDPVVYSDLTAANGYQTADDAKSAVTAVYSGLRAHGYFYYNGYQKVITDFATDIGISPAGGDINQMSYFRWSPTNRYFRLGWRFIYKVVSNANLAIDKIPNIDMDEALKTRYIAEARMIRGLAYLDLSDAFGPIPLPLSSEINIDEPIEPSSMEDVNKAILEDLKFAEANLPETYGSANATRATKGAAKALLCKFYMRDRNWSEALKYANDVMALANKGVYALNPSWDQLFSEANQIDKEHIFAITNVAGTMGALLTKHSGPTDHPDVSAWNYYALSIHFWRKFDENDPRRDFFWYNYTGKSGRYYKMPDVGETESPDDNTILLANVATKKFSNNMVSVSYDDGFTFPILRLADIILCKAEIMNELDGPSTEAIGLINDIRARAGAPLLSTNAASYSKESLRNILCDERGFELHFECKRRADLIRMGKYVETCNAYLNDIGETPNVTDKYKLFPYPQEEATLNPHLDNSDRVL